MKKRMFWIIVIVLAVIQMVFVPLFNLEKLVFNQAYYIKNFRENHVYKTIGLDSEKLHYVNRRILGYLKGEIDELQTVVAIKGRQQPFFTQRELIHMKDVRKLFEAGFMLRNTAGAMLLAIILFLFLTKRANYIVKGLFFSSLLSLMGVLTVIWAIRTNFQVWFVKFHKIFFNNDYWMLDPKTHNLIKMFPQKFFQVTVFKIISAAIIQLALLAAVSGLVIWGKGPLARIKVWRN